MVFLPVIQAILIGSIVGRCILLVLLAVANKSTFKMYTPIELITSRRDKEDVNVKATVKSRTRVTNWGKRNGTKLSGVLEDNTDKIDFVGWDGVTKYMDVNLVENKTVILRNIRIKSCLSSYTRTKKDVQLLFTQDTVVEITNDAPLLSPVELTPLSELTSLEDNTRVNITGRILHVGNIEKFNNADRLMVKIRDKDTSVCGTFWRSSAHTFEGKPGDIIALEGAAVKSYPNFFVLNFTTADYKLNEPELEFLRSIPLDNNVKQNLSPEKDSATHVDSIKKLNSETPKQTVNAVPTCIVHEIYELCPLQGCSKSMNSKDGIFFCDKCKKKYLASGSGIRLNVVITEKGVSQDIVMFNSIACKFLGMQPTDFENKSPDDLFTQVEGKRFTFTLTQSRKDGEYICTDVRSLSAETTSTITSETMSNSLKRKDYSCGDNKFGTDTTVITPIDVNPHTSMKGQLNPVYIEDQPRENAALDISHKYMQKTLNSVSMNSNIQSPFVETQIPIRKCSGASYTFTADDVNNECSDLSRYTNKANILFTTPRNLEQLSTSPPQFGGTFLGTHTSPCTSSTIHCLDTMSTTSTAYPPVNLTTPLLHQQSDDGQQLFSGLHMPVVSNNSMQNNIVSPPLTNLHGEFPSIATQNVHVSPFVNTFGVGNVSASSEAPIDLTTPVRNVHTPHSIENIIQRDNTYQYDSPIDLTPNQMRMESSDCTDVNANVIKKLRYE